MIRPRIVGFKRMNAEQRFMALVKVDPATGCWLWQGSLTRALEPYPRFYDPEKKKTFRAHRWAYEHWIGAVPADWDVHHECRNKLCVRPDARHLIAKPKLQHVIEEGVPPGVNALKTHCPEGHPLSGDNLMLVGKRRRQCYTCWLKRHRRTNREWMRARRKQEHGKTNQT